jgi:hypothetical protein
MSNKFNSDMVSDNQGVAIGKVGSYVKNFKDIEAGKSPSEPVKSSNKLNEKRPSSASASLASLPKELNSNTESEIFNHFYIRFGDGTLNDFDNIAGKIASSINRLYNKSFSIEDSIKKLSELVKSTDFKLKDTDSNTSPQSTSSKNNQNASSVEPKKKLSINLEEKMYPFLNGLEPLNEGEKELLMFIETSNLCFSSNGYEYFLTVKKKSCFDNLFNFNPKEELVFNMFKEQLGDEHKAKKLVLMSRIINSSPESNLPEIKPKNSKRTK